MPKKKDIWKQIIRIIQSRSKSNGLRFWFSRTSLLSLTTKKAIIKVPNRFIAIWLTDHYLEDIKDAFLKTCGYVPHISYSYSSLTELSIEEPVQAIGFPSSLFSPVLPEHTFDSFILDNNNKFAQVAALSFTRNTLSNTTSTLLIFSPLTCGKTHLLHAIANKILEGKPNANVGYICCSDFISTIESINEPASLQTLCNSLLAFDILIIDDIHLLSKYHRPQMALRNITDILFSYGTPMVFSSHERPTSITGLNKHLASRFQSGILAEIPRIGEQTRWAIIQRKLAKKKVTLPDDIMFYLMNTTQDLYELLEYTEKLANQAITSGSIELSQIKKLIGPNVNPTITPEQIIDCVARYYDIHPSQIKSNSRDRNTCHCRHVAMYLCKDIIGLRLREIGKIFRKMNHSTILYAIKKIEKEIQHNWQTRKEVFELTHIIRYC